MEYAHHTNKTNFTFFPSSQKEADRKGRDKVSRYSHLATTPIWNEPSNASRRGAVCRLPLRKITRAEIAGAGGLHKVEMCSILRKLFHCLSHENRQIHRPSRSNKIAIYHNVFVLPYPAGGFDVFGYAVVPEGSEMSILEHI
jgi:hypothetical protein